MGSMRAGDCLGLLTGIFQCPCTPENSAAAALSTTFTASKSEKSEAQQGQPCRI
jgi:hypothetical protein